LTTGFADADGGYWPRRINQTFNPRGGGWKYHVDAINHDYAQANETPGR
jgi:hypothetical protein